MEMERDGAHILSEETLREEGGYFLVSKSQYADMVHQGWDVGGVASVTPRGYLPNVGSGDVIVSPHPFGHLDNSFKVVGQGGSVSVRSLLEAVPHLSVQHLAHLAS